METTVFGHRIQLDTDLVEAGPTAIEAQLQEYSSGDRHSFSVAVSFPDSFTGRVMQALTGIEYGTTATYSELADELGTAAVAIGQACANNPVPVIVPCHRVVGSDGIGGYQYPGLKKRLLRHEDVCLSSSSFSSINS